jgi:hypothetical protein
MWLEVKLCTGLIASRVVGAFESDIERLPALAKRVLQSSGVTFKRQYDVHLALRDLTIADLIKQSE